MRVLLFKSDEGEKPSVSKVWEHLGKLMGDRDYSPLYDRATGRLWVKVSSDEGTTELFFKDTENGVFVYVTWKYDNKTEETFRECETWEELEDYVKWAVNWLEN
jgi:hypothetical protein